jgi:uncharacterized protein YjiS (DUF1127 family)
MSLELLRSHPAYVLGQAAERGGALLLDGLFSRLGQAIRRQRSRREITRLDDHMLRDIGVSRAAALYEADKPLWRA